LANHREIITALREALERHKDLFERAVAAGGQSAEFPAIILRQAFHFSVRTLSAIDRVLLEPESTAMALTLARPFYELAIRVLWSAREPAGWDRLLAHFAEEEKKFAKGVINACAHHERARDRLASLQPILERRDAAGCLILPAPKLMRMVRDIVEADSRERATPSLHKYDELEYTGLYRIMCRPAHGNVLSSNSADPDSDLRLAMTVLVLSTFRLLQTFCHVAVRDAEEQATVTKLEDQAVQLILECRQLSF
jgi:hypothetical protein